MNEHYNKEKPHKRGRKPYCSGPRKRVTFYLDQTAIDCLDQLFSGPDESHAAYPFCGTKWISSMAFIWSGVPFSWGKRSRASATVE